MLIKQICVLSFRSIMMNCYIFRDAAFRHFPSLTNRLSNRQGVSAQPVAIVYTSILDETVGRLAQTATV